MEQSISAQDAAVFCSLSPDLHCILSTDGRIRWASPRWDPMLGHAPEDLEGVSFFDLLHEQDAAIVRDEIERAIAGRHTQGLLARIERADGACVWIDWRFSASGTGAVFGFGRDVTERRKSADAVETLRTLEDEAERIAELGSWRLDLATGLFTGSPQMYRLLGLDPGAGKVDITDVLRDAVHPDDADMVQTIAREVLADGVPRPLQARLVLPEGTKWVEARGRQVCTPSGRPVAITGFVQDITERKQAEAEAAEREMRLQAVIDNAPFGAHMYRLDPDDRLVFIGYNQKAEEMLGFDHGPLVGLTLEEAFPGNVGTETPQEYRRVAREGTTWEVDQYAYDANQIAGVFEVYAFSFGPNRVSVFFRDITDQKRAEASLVENVQRFRAMFEQASVGIAEVGTDAKWTRVNDRLCEILGYSAEELAELTFQEITHPDDVAADTEAFMAMMAGDGVPFRTEKRYIRKDGTPVWVDLSAAVVRDDDGKVLHFVTVVVDIDERKRTEHALANSELFVQSILDTTPNLIYIYSVTENRNIYANREVSEFLGYTPDEVRDFGSTLFEQILHPDDAALVAEHHAACAAAWDGQVLECEYRMRHADGEWRWLHSRDVPFKRNEDSTVTQILGFCQDVTARKKGDEALRESNRRLEHMVYDVAEAMGRVIEARDPYTRGHQERVARISKAIAVEMELSDDDTAAVEMAALVHDIGKLSIPAEILSMPRELTPLEFSLIKEHPAKGYEILKDIDFPWPIAEIVLHHHERMDGSGYPDGLKGEALLPARILAVADVVEAMASHRPYRPALGVRSAMEELEAHSEKYDPDVVAACLRLHGKGELDL